MFRINALLLALLIACMPLSLAESASLIPQEMIQADKVNYDTVTAEKSTFLRTVSTAAEEYYPNSYVLRCEGSGVRFQNYEVIRGNIVSEGDVLARFTLESDAVELESLKIQLSDARKALEKRIDDEEEAAQERAQAFLAASDPWEKELLTLQSQRAELALEQYELSQNRTIGQLEERIDEIELRMQGNVIVAPTDGVIIGTEYKREGDKLYDGEPLISMYRTDGMLLQIDNSSGYFRYGMEVTLETGSNKDRIQLPGRVVGADLLIPSAERTGKAYIEVDLPEDPGLTRPIISGATISVENVWLIPRKLLSMDGGKHCVTVLADGIPTKRYIHCSVNTAISQAWVLQGLDPDEEIIIE